ncbi:MAG TPA: DUF1156 domain-containing protein, partial [Polyangiaceae bacterium]|nr:DUF1156 domain-containing protein [Polyangiaceae bacterium]
MSTTYRKKLIEVAMPLDAINKASAREKSIRHGHPSTLHLWWARRPLAACRAVLFGQLVDDPSAWPDRFPSEAEQDAERQRIFRIIEELVKWENSNNEVVLDAARQEIARSFARARSEGREERSEGEKLTPHSSSLTPASDEEEQRLDDAVLADDVDAKTIRAYLAEVLPPVHDPFAGGGSIPLEAQRLGLRAIATDLNPVAVMINKALIEIPPKFAGRAPVGPPLGSTASRRRRRREGGTPSLPGYEWPGATGLAEDVRRYGAWMREEAFKRIGHLYPKVTITEEMAQGRPDLEPYVGQERTVIAWLWARTVASPNPAFRGVHVPLVSNFFLSTKKGKETWVEPVVEGSTYRFEIRRGTPGDAAKIKMGTKLGRGANFGCVVSGTPIAPDYIKAEGKAGRMGARLMAVVLEGRRTRLYVPPTEEQERIAASAEPEWRPEQDLPKNPRWFSPPDYGMPTYGDLFTPRQIVALTTFSDLVTEAREKVREDYLRARASRPRTTWHRTNLPHFEAGEVAQSITFRLHGSIPRAKIEAWQAELKHLDDTARQVELHARIEEALAHNSEANWLSDSRISKVVEDAFHYFDGTRYRLHAWVVMPNHVHVLVTPLYGNSLSSIVHSWKSYTAKQANDLLGRTGSFWAKDYFDRMIRDERHFNAVLAYIHNNPVKARLCETPEAWRWSSAWERGRLAVDEAKAGRLRSQDDLSPADDVKAAKAGEAWE